MYIWPIRLRGVVKAGVKDTRYTNGEHSDTSSSVVYNLIKSLSLPNVKILQGIFPDDTGHEVNQPIALLHCDVDVYQSSKEIVEWALPRMSIGSVIIFDDYGIYSVDSVKKYVDYLRKNFSNEFTFINNYMGQCILIKK